MQQVLAVEMLVMSRAGFDEVEGCVGLRFVWLHEATRMLVFVEVVDGDIAFQLHRYMSALQVES